MTYFKIKKEAIASIVSISLMFIEVYFLGIPGSMPGCWNYLVS
jgi:hypothetical protein